jgi:hypothetical protein
MIDNLIETALILHIIACLFVSVYIVVRIIRGE